VIGEVEEFLGLELPSRRMVLRPIIADVAELVVQALRIFAQHQSGRPAAAADENIFPIDVEGASADRVEVGGDFANANSLVERSLIPPLASNSMVSG